MKVENRIQSEANPENSESWGRGLWWASFIDTIY